MYFAQVFANRQLKKLKLVFKNAAKVIDPVVILFSADKEISGSLSVCVGWCCRGYLSISPLPVAPAPPRLGSLTVLLSHSCVCVCCVCLYYHFCY